MLMRSDQFDCAETGVQASTMMVNVNASNSRCITGCLDVTGNLNPMFSVSPRWNFKSLIPNPGFREPRQGARLGRLVALQFRA